VKLGSMRHRILLQRRVDHVNADGETMIAYADVATVWGEVSPLSGREYITAKQVAAEVTTRIRIRHRHGIDATWRAIVQTQFSSPAAFDVYDVVAPLADPVVNTRWLTLLCVRRDAEGYRSQAQAGGTSNSHGDGE